jgi:predicted PurR-regulated permease PerM
MAEFTWRERAFRMTLGTAAVVVIIAGMRTAAPLLVQVLLATLLAILAAGPAGALKARGVPTGVAVLVVILGMLGAGVAVGSLIGTSFAEFTRAIPSYEARLNAELMRLVSWVGDRGVELPEGGLLDLFDPGALLSVIGRLISGVQGLLTNGAIILLIVVFMLLEASTFPVKLRTAFGEGSAALQGFVQFSGSVKRYLVIKSIMSAATGVTVALFLALLRVDFPLLWGFLAFFLNFIPNIGSVIASVPPVFLALVQFGPGWALLVAAGFLVINTLWSNVVEPRVMGRGVGLSPLVIFLSLIFWAWVLGPVGMVLSVPLTMILKIALESSRHTQPLAILLGSKPPGPEPA